MNIKVLQNNWYRNKIEILKSYRSAMKHSKDRMIHYGKLFFAGQE